MQVPLWLEVERVSREAPMAHLATGPDQMASVSLHFAQLPYSECFWGRKKIPLTGRSASSDGSENSCSHELHRFLYLITH